MVVAHPFVMLRIVTNYGKKFYTFIFQNIANDSSGWLFCVYEAFAKFSVKLNSGALLVE